MELSFTHMRRFLVFIVFMMLYVNVTAAGVKLVDLIGDWKFVPAEGMVMAGDIVMNVSSVSMSQSLYSNKKKSKSDLFHASFYLSDTPETPWNSNMVGKVQSGAYIVRNSNGSVSLSEVSFDDNGMLVLTPYNSQNGFIMRFRKMTDEEISDVKTAKIADEMGLMQGYAKAKNIENKNPMLSSYIPGSLAWKLRDFVSRYNTNDIRVLRIGGPLNAIDLYMLSLPDEYKKFFPNINTLDLSMAWFVTDSIAYHCHEFRNCNHDYFSNIRGMHMVKDLKTDTIGVLFKSDGDGMANVCYDRYGWLVEEKKDSLYWHYCTTIEDCVSEFSFFNIPWLERIIFPMSTREIHYNAVTYCPKLKEIIIPSGVMGINNGAFVGNPNLETVKVAEDSKLLKKLSEDIGGKNEIFINNNPQAGIETYKTIRPEVTFTIRGRLPQKTRKVDVSDYTNHKRIRQLEADSSEFRFEVTVPQYSVIGFGNLRQAVIAEGSDVYIDLETDSLSGTPLNDKLHKYNKVLRICEKQLYEARVKLEDIANEDSVVVYKKRVDVARKVLYSFVSRFFLSNYDNCLSAYVLARYEHEMPLEMSYMMIMTSTSAMMADPLLNNLWKWVREFTHTVHLDYNGYSDPRFMQPLTNVKAGKLETMLTPNEWNKVRRMKIDGKLNTDDIRWLRSLCRYKNMQALDLSDAYIVDKNNEISTYLPDSAFSFNIKLKYIALPKNIRTIGIRCFYDCNGLEFIKMNDDIHTISSEAFANARNLRDFRLPSKLEKIGHRAFLQCANIRNMILPGGVKQIDIEAFALCRNLRKLYIPAATKKIGRAMTHNSLSAVISIDEANKDYRVVSNVIIGCTDEARKAIGQTVTK